MIADQKNQASDDDSVDSSLSAPPSEPSSNLSSPSNSQFFEPSNYEDNNNSPVFFNPYTGPDVNLNSKWRFWFEPQTQTPALNSTSYLKQLRTSSSFRSLAQIYNFSIENNNKFQRTLLFKEGIKPIWEDPNNFDGGRFFVHCQHEKQAFDSFLLVVKTILPGEIIDPDDICGVLYAYKPPNRYSVSIWHKNSKDKPRIKEIRGHLKHLFNVKTVSYHNHRASIKLSHQPSYQRSECGMSTYPPKKNQKKSSDTLRFEASLNMLDNPQVMISAPITKERSMSYEFNDEFSPLSNQNYLQKGSSNNNNNSRPSRSVNTSRKSSFDYSMDKSPEKALIKEPFLNV